jgi:hypothetical protein
VAAAEQSCTGFRSGCLHRRGRAGNRPGRHASTSRQPPTPASAPPHPPSRATRPRPGRHPARSPQSPNRRPRSPDRAPHVGHPAAEAARAIADAPHPQDAGHPTTRRTCRRDAHGSRTVPQQTPDREPRFPAPHQAITRAVPQFPDRSQSPTRVCATVTNPHGEIRAAAAQKCLPDSGLQFPGQARGTADLREGHRSAEVGLRRLRRGAAADPRPGNRNAEVGLLRTRRGGTAGHRCGNREPQAIRLRNRGGVAPNPGRPSSGAGAWQLQLPDVACEDPRPRRRIVGAGRLQPRRQVGHGATRGDTIGRAPSTVQCCGSLRASSPCSCSGS